MTAFAAPIPATPNAIGATPVMAQFFAAKAQAPNALIFFRMGDFYELFFDDARQAAEAVGIALTHRGAHAGAPIPMAGVPVHAADSYLAKLIRAGFQVAVCEQMEAPAEARKRGARSVVRREITRVVTPGTLTEEGLLEARGANRLAAVAQRSGQLAVASAEISTGEVDCQLVALADLGSALAAMRPSEILIVDSLLSEPAVSAAMNAGGGVIQPMATALAEPAASEARVRRLYGVQTLDGFGVLSGAEIAALGLLAAHLDTTQAGRAIALRAPRRASETEYMAIDPATRASLEIERSLAGGRDGSLLDAVDRTITAAGARQLSARLSRPLLSLAAIDERLDALAWLADRGDVREGVRTRLRHSGDLARALSRLTLSRGGPRDLAVLRDALAAGVAIAVALAGETNALQPLPEELNQALGVLDPAAWPALDALLRELADALEPSLPLEARAGGFVGAGISEELDQARVLRDDSRRLVAALEGRLARESGVALRIRHNAVLGYFVEASARAAEPLFQPPLSAIFIHRQTLANQARFTTTELGELGLGIARAAERALALEMALFEGWSERARQLAGKIQAAAAALAQLDVAAGLAEWAVEVGASRPSVDASRVFEATAAWHPVVEAAVRRAGAAFTANDCQLDGAGATGPRLAIVTGPNMAGKSTYLRQNALLAILAQAGCFVPAKSLRLGVVDRLFSRVGAGDDLARGRSTFMAEMVETAAILTQATPRSLVILDEIGRGTATYDGLAIAWACAEALHDANECRALFATHYHELANLEERLAHVANLSLKANTWNGELVFLHEAGPGRADRSYGVQVAKLAGVPAAVVARAREVLDRLEGEDASHVGLQDLPLFAMTEAFRAEAPIQSPLQSTLASLDLDGMSPREAMDALYRLKSLL